MDFSVFDRERILWKKLLRDAQAGDKKAMERICLYAEPILQDFFRVNVLRSRLGRDEIRGIAWLALMKFIAGFKGEVVEETFPRLLYKVIRCALLNETRRERDRMENEVAEGGDRGDSCPDKVSLYDTIHTDGRETEPEQALLQAELKKEVQAALTHTSLRERECIRALYFDGKTSTEYARETGCTSQFISKTKIRTLNRMRRLLKKNNVM